MRIFLLSASLATAALFASYSSRPAAPPSRGRRGENLPRLSRPSAESPCRELLLPGSAPLIALYQLKFHVRSASFFLHFFFLSPPLFFLRSSGLAISPFHDNSTQHSPPRQAPEGRNISPQLLLGSTLARKQLCTFGDALRPAQCGTSV